MIESRSRIPVVESSIGPADEQCVLEAVRSGWASSRGQETSFSDMADLMKFRTDDLLNDMVEFHTICRKHEARLRREIAATHQR